MLVTLRPSQVIADVLQDCPPQKKTNHHAHLNEEGIRLVVTLLCPVNPFLRPVFPHTRIVPHAFYTGMTVGSNLASDPAYLL